nr:MAG TPA: hypothetical protein [Caudoviricetes sp.]
MYICNVVLCDTILRFDENDISLLRVKSPAIKKG